MELRRQHQQHLAKDSLLREREEVEMKSTWLVWATGYLQGFVTKERAGG